VSGDDWRSLIKLGKVRFGSVKFLIPGAFRPAPVARKRHFPRNAAPHSRFTVAGGVEL
jgi:hypothetical protein